MGIVELRNVHKSYEEGDGRIQVLKNVNLSVEEGEFLVILGPSGSGKTTILNMIGGLDVCDSGEIMVEGREYSRQSDKVMSQYRRNTLGFVFQSFNLIPVLSVYENIVFPVEIDGSKVDKEYIESLMKELGIYEKRHELPTKLSGGQQQRVAIARALANRPKIILADEPTGNLDSHTGEEVLRILLDGVKRHHQTLIMITHNQKIAALADRVMCMKDGILSQEEMQNDVL